MADISKEQAVQLAEASGLLNCEFDNFDDCILALVQAAFKLGRNAGLDAAKKKCDAEVAEFHSSNESRNTAEYLAAAIESLKDNTP